MVINVGDGVLLYIGNANVLVRVNITNRRDKLSGKDVDQSRFACTVGTDDSDTGAE